MFDNEPQGAIAKRNCINPDCLAEPGERHDADCTPDPMRSGDVWNDPKDWS